MIKVFTLNKNNKIELTKEELEQILNQSFWEGYYKKNNFYTYTSPYTTSPYTITANTITSGGTKTIDITTTNNDAQIKYNNK